MLSMATPKGLSLSPPTGIAQTQRKLAPQAFPVTPNVAAIWRCGVEGRHENS